MRKTGIPKFDPANEILEGFFQEPVSFFALAANNNPNSDSGGSSDYIGYNSSSISEPSGFFGDSNLSDGPWLLENDSGGTAYSSNFLSHLNDFPSALASSFGTSFIDYGKFPRGYTIAEGSLTFEPAGFSPGLFYLRAVVTEITLLAR